MPPICYKCDRPFSKGEEYSVQNLVTTRGAKVEIGWHPTFCPRGEIEAKINTRLLPTYDELQAALREERDNHIDQLVRINTELQQTCAELNRLRDAWLQAKHLYEGDTHARAV